jgi:hypothetical protein
MTDREIEALLARGGLIGSSHKAILARAQRPIIRWDEPEETGSMADAVFSRLVKG